MADFLADFLNSDFHFPQKMIYLLQWKPFKND